MLSRILCLVPLAFALGAMAAGPLQPNPCDYHCRMKKQFYDYNNPGVWLFTVETCRHCTLGYCVDNADVNPALQCVEMDLAQTYSRYDDGGPRCPQAAGHAFSEGYLAGAPIGPFPWPLKPWWCLLEV